MKGKSLRKDILFLQKKNQKNFYQFGPICSNGRGQIDKSFIASFFAKKEGLS